MSDLKPRQFDLFSLFFGEEQSINSSTDGPIPPSSMYEQSQPMHSSTSEKSFFDAIRDGLNYLDSNDGKIGSLLDSTSNTTEKIQEKLNQTVDFSLFDLLMDDEEMMAVTHQPDILNQEKTAIEFASSSLDPASDTSPEATIRPFNLESNPIYPLTESPLKLDVIENENEPSLTDLFGGILSNSYEDYSYSDPDGSNFTDYENKREEIIGYPDVKPEAQDEDFTNKENNENEKENMTVPITKDQRKQLPEVNKTGVYSTQTENITTEQVIIVKPASNLSETNLMLSESNMLSTTKIPVIIYLAESSKLSNNAESTTQSSRLSEEPTPHTVKSETMEIKMFDQSKKQAEVGRPSGWNSLVEIRRPIETNKNESSNVGSSGKPPEDNDSVIKVTTSVIPVEILQSTNGTEVIRFKKPSLPVEIIKHTEPEEQNIATELNRNTELKTSTELDTFAEPIKYMNINTSTNIKKPSNTILHAGIKQPANISKPIKNTDMFRPLNLNKLVEPKRPQDVIEPPGGIKYVEINRPLPTTTTIINEQIQKIKPTKTAEGTKSSSSLEISTMKVIDPLLTSSSTESLLNTTKFNKTSSKPTATITEDNKIPAVQASSNPEVIHSSQNTSSPIVLPMEYTKIKPDDIVISSNPSILETDINYDYDEPTLPPSLPNLKIIPFLPTDAVKNDRNQFTYDYHKSIYQTTVKYPILTENYPLVPDYAIDSQIHGVADYHGYGVDETDYPSTIDKSTFYKLKGEFGSNADNDAEIDRNFYNHHSGSYPTFTENYDSLKSNMFGPHQFGTFANDDRDPEKINDYPLFDEKYDSTEFDYDSFGSFVISTAKQHGNIMPIGGEHGSTSIDKKVYTKIGFNPSKEDLQYPLEVKNKFLPPNKTEGKFDYFFFVNFVLSTCISLTLLLPYMPQV